MLVEILIWTLVIYIVLVFKLSIFLLPNLGWKARIKGDIPLKNIKELEAIGKKYKNQEKVLDEVLKYQFKRFESSMFQQITEFPLLFRQSIPYLWKKKGYLHCHQQILFIRYFLLKTKRFTERDIKLRLTTCYFMIHQYMKVRVNKKWIKIDPFAMRMGQKKGEVLHGSLEYLFRKK